MGNCYHAIYIRILRKQLFLDALYCYLYYASRTLNGGYDSPEGFWCLRTLGIAVTIQVVLVGIGRSSIGTIDWCRTPYRLQTGSAADPTYAR